MGWSGLSRSETRNSKLFLPYVRPVNMYIHGGDQMYPCPLPHSPSRALALVQQPGRNRPTNQPTLGTKNNIRRTSITFTRSNTNRHNSNDRPKEPRPSMFNSERRTPPNPKPAVQVDAPPCVRAFPSL